MVRHIYEKKIYIKKHISKGIYMDEYLYKKDIYIEKIYIQKEYKYEMDIYIKKYIEKKY